MFKTFLVCTDGSSYGDVACEYAIHLVDVFEGRLTALHVLDSRMLEGPWFADIAGGLGVSPYLSLGPQFEQLMQQKGEAVMAGLKARLAETGREGECRLERGHPARVILEQEVRAEMVVLGQRGEHQEFGGDMIGSTVERVIRRSLKPCLVTPSRFQPVSSVLVAYDGSDMASKALQVAADFCAVAKSELMVLTVAEGMEEAATREVLGTGMDLLAAHECEAQGLVGEGLAEEAIIGMARERDCDLIVMGAYGHTRIRELILGSTTSQVISMCSLPVLLVR